ncbi:anaphase-promoting complex subunit cdc27 [Haplosporangium sp. Z 27]|nr:anaphase-promoting complex subunit cdc27 [Haplosporangium sp. Z 27]
MHSKEGQRRRGQFWKVVSPPVAASCLHSAAWILGDTSSVVVYWSGSWKITPYQGVYRYADGNGEPDRASVLNLMGHTARHDTMQGDNMESTFADSSKNNIFPAQELFDSAKHYIATQRLAASESDLLKEAHRSQVMLPLVCFEGVEQGHIRKLEDHDQLQHGATTSTVLPSTDTEPWVEEEGLQIIIDIFRILSRAIGLLSLNKFSESVAEFESLPFEHLQSGWVQCQLGKCKFGMVDYISAVKYFERARELEPNLHKDMEIYSTTLWHLQKETMLSTLAKELKDSNHHSPQAWVALGNAYSLKRDHDQALKCFRRAVQLNDRFAYAHALSGHEYTDLEEYDKAQTEFRIAMSIEPRNYHAWFGMGLIYDKMGKHDLALIHYKEAHKINPSSSVSLYRVGTSQEKMSRITEALRTFEEAITLEPTNVAARFSKAKIQADMGQYKEALKELEVIIQYSPNEPKVFVLQGKVLSKMGNKEQALKYLTWALNLDRKSSHTIRDIIEKVDQNIDNEEERYEVKVDVDL